LWLLNGCATSSSTCSLAGFAVVPFELKRERTVRRWPGVAE
jgi:hypothetical protein